MPPRTKKAPPASAVALNGGSRHEPGIASAALTREQILDLYNWIRLTRPLEERLVALYRQTKVVGGLFR
jgi:TPP-dependent pyruvate/acetoin dehydrogenase alpha subunit